MDERLQENKNIRKEFPFLYPILGGLILVGMGVLLGWIVFSEKEKQIDYVLSCTTNLISILITVFVINLLAERRERERYKKQLIQQMGSRSNDFALSAAEILRRNPEWKDGSFSRHVFEQSRLQKADLRFANFRNSHFIRCDLFGADFTGADLRGAFLYHSNLQGATFEATGIKAHFDETTMLPDQSYWKPETDMRCFTDPTHSDFWRTKDDPSSPAFRENEAT